MGMTVEAYDGRSLRVRAPLQPNLNVHGTAFAGSLYSACVLTGWGAIWLALREQGLRGVIYAAESTVTYRKAVGGDFACSCALETEALRAGLETLEASGRASFELVCTIDYADKRAVTFTGKYVVHAAEA
jgi:thioesterase domain-containing protein